MNTRVSVGALAVVVTLATCLQGQSAALNTREVAEDAMWVAHLDASALRRTVLGRHILEQMDQGPAARGLEAFTAMMQFDPRQDLEAVTLYGMGHGEEEGVALLRGRFNTPHLVTLIRGNPDYESHTHRSHTIHSWIDENKPGKRTFGCVMGPDQIAVSGSESLVRHAVDVIEGRAGDMASADSLPGLSASSDAIFFLGSADMRGMPDVHPQAMLLRQTDALSLSLAERGGEFVGEMLMTAKDTSTATAVHSIAQGLINLVLLDSAQDPTLLELANALVFRVEGANVVGRLQYPSADLIDIVMAMKKKDPNPAE